MIKIERPDASIWLLDTIMYDAQGRLHKSNSIDVTGSLVYSYTYLRNDKGQVIRKVGTPIDGRFTPNDHSYTYDHKGRVIADTTYLRQSTSIVSYWNFSYDANNNINELEIHNVMNPTSLEFYTYRYDDKPNPYHLQGPDYFL